MEEVLTNDPPKGATKVNGSAKATDSYTQTQPASEGPKGATLVKKKDDTASTAGSASQKPAAPVTEPSVPSGASKPASKTPNQTYQQRVSNLLSTTQNQFNEEVNKKKAELQAIVDKDPSQEKSVNEQFQSFISQKETEYNQQLDKWVGMYQKDFQQKDFEANKETNPLKTAAKTAWTTLAYDLPSQLYSTRAATSSGIQKLLDETVGKVEPIEKEKAGKIEQAFEGVLKNVFGVEDAKLGERTAGQNQGKEVILADVLKSIELSKISAENKKYLVNSLDKVKDGDFVDWMNYAGAAIGQGVGQIPASVATFGASSIGQQIGSIYMDSLQKIAEDEGITVEDVIRQGKDDVVYPILFGVGTGLLDYVGAKNVGGAISKDFVMGSLRNRALHTIAAGGIEAATETAQTGLEDIGVNKARGKSWRETISQFDSSKLPDAALQGLIAGTFLSGAGQTIKVATDKMAGDRIKVKKSPMETIKKAIDEVDVNDIKSVDAVAKEITESIQNPVEDIKPKTQVYDESKTTEETGSVVSSEKPAEDSSIDSTVENTTATTEGEQPDVRQSEYNEQTKQEAIEDKEYEVIPRSKEGLIEGKNFDYAPNKALSEDQKKIESEFASELNENFDQKKEEYIIKFGNVLDADKAKELSSDYQADPSNTASAVHNPASSFLFRVYTDMLAQPAPKGKENKVTFVVGGPGAGKTTEVNKLQETSKSQIIYDTIFSNERISKNQINRALNAKKDVEIRFVYRDPIESFEAMIDRSSGGRRIVPISVFAPGHVDARNTIEKLKNTYHGNKRVDIQTVGSIGDEISTKDLTTKLKEKADQFFSEGKITKQQYEVLTGKSQSREGSAAEAPTIIPNEQISEKGRQEEVLSPPAQQEVTEEINQQELSPPPAVAQTKVGQRMAASEEPSQIKEKVSEGDKYIPKQIIKTDQEAKKILDDWDDTEFAERVIRDRTNGMPGETRGAIGAHLYEQYKKEAESAKNPEEKQRAYDKAADIAVWVAQNLTKAGQETAIAGKIWKSLLGSEDLLVAAMEKQVGQQRTKKLEPIREEVTRTKEQIEAEIRKRVTEGVEAQLPKAKLITKEQRRKISDAFDSLKIDDIKDAANDVIRVLGATVWNGSIEVMKRATLAGADIANAIQQGIDYVRENYKGTDFDEAEFRSIVTPVLEQSNKPVKRRRVKSSEISEDVIKAPKLSRKQKRNVIDKTVEAFNEEKLTDEKFDEIYSTELGIKSFSPEERTEIRDLAKIISEAEKFSESVKNNFTKENLDKHKALFKKAQLANQKLNRMSREQSDVWKTLATIMQLNLLSSISFVRNMYSNTVFQPMRFASTALAMIPDRIVSGLAKLELIGESYKDPTIDLVALQKGYFQGGWNGTIEGLYQMKHGQLASERELREISGKFDPVAALQRLKAGDQTTKQKINDYIEATLGWPAEVSARLLNLGDKPFRRAAELARGFEIGTLKGLKGVELAKFVAFPDEITAQEMDKSGKEATFQNDRVPVQYLQNMITKLTDWLWGPFKLAPKLVLPFLKTPANILFDSLDYALPPVTFARGAYEISRGNKRTGSMLIGKSLVGAMIWQVSYMLLEAGLMTSGDDDKEGKSAERKSIMYDTAPPNSINTSALIRMLAGEKPDIKNDDVWVNFKDMGIMGLLMDTFSNSYYKSVKDGKDPSDNVNDLFGGGALNIVAGSLQQSFLQGTNTLLEALKDPEGYGGQKWVVNTTDALSSIIVPRAISAISPASDEYIRDTRDNKTGEALINSFKNKFFMGDTMPARVNLWGEKITGNPEGRTRALYYLFDPTKFKEVSTDDFKWKIYKQWRDSGFDDDWLPGMPDRSVSVKGVKIPLTSEEYSRYATAVGQNRKSLASGYMMTAPKPDKKMLKMYYDYGRQTGAAQFLLSTGWQVKTKEELQKIADSRK